MSDPPTAAGRYTGRLAIVFGLTAGFVLIEVVAGWLTGSLALIADAGHMATDAFGLGLALVAIRLAARPPDISRGYGYARLEILAALANAIVLFGVGAYILIEAWRRFQEPPEVASIPMMLVASAGLVINVVGAWLLHAGADESLNLQGAFLEVVSDLLGSVAVIIAGAIIFFTGWVYADPVFSVLIGLFIIPRTWRLLREAVHVLMEGAPADLDIAAVPSTLETAPGVHGVHDFHVWTITSGSTALSAHLVAPEGGAELVNELRSQLRDRFAIAHATIQVERSPCPDTGRHA